MLWGHGVEGGRSRAERLLRDGLGIAMKLGMKPLENRIAVLLDSVSTGATRVYHDGLTAREVDVLKGIAEGKTNQEIEYALKISEHTVGNHVRRIYAKVSVTNRVEAATYAVRCGLVNLKQ